MYIEATAPVHTSTIEVTGLDVSQCLINQPDYALKYSLTKNIVPQLSRFQSRHTVIKPKHRGYRTNGSTYSVVLHIPKTKCKVSIDYHVSTFLSKTGQSVVQNN